MYRSPDFDSQPVALKNRMKTEERIVKSLINEFLSQGLWLAADNGEERTPITQEKNTLIVHLIETDEDYLLVYSSDRKESHIGSIYLVYGNDGWDVMSDWTAALYPYMPKTLALIEKLQ